MTQFAIAAVIISLSLSRPGYANHINSPEFLSVAVFKLSEHINWPNAKDIKRYNIHIIDENPDVEIQLKQIAAIRKLHNRPIFVSRSNNLKVPADTQIIFISPHHTQLLPELLKKILNLPVLVISFDAVDQRIVMINFKKDDKNKIRFEVNKANIINNGMSVDPEIILLGGTEIDVALLFKDSQTELLKKEKKLKVIENKIKKINHEKQLMEQVLSNLTNTINAQKLSYQKLKVDTLQKEFKIKEQVSELNNREKHLNEQRVEIEKRSAILKKQQQNINTQTDTIEKQNKIIDAQKNTLVTSSATIEIQQNYLLTLSIVSILTALIAIAAYWLYKKNKSINTELNLALTKTRQYANQVDIVNEQLQSFSYTVSHDLRTPLRGISGFSKILIEDFSTNLTGDAKKYLNRIIDNVRKMDNLITDILMLSKLSRSEVKFSNNVNLSEIVIKELEHLNQTGLRNVTEFNIKQNIVCRCDPKLIQIAMANIIGNAWKYTPANKKAKFEFDKKIINHETVYYFRDNGVGFNMKYANKLFEPFQRLHTDEQFEGTGIGLATVKRVINLHQGNIWAESEVDKGTTFYFTINV